MKVKVTMEMVLELEKDDVKALKNANPTDVLQSAQMQSAEIKVNIKKLE